MWFMPRFQNTFIFLISFFTLPQTCEIGRGNAFVSFDVLGNLGK